MADEASLILEVFEDQGYELKSHYSRVDSARLLLVAAENLLSGDDSGSDSDTSDADPIPIVKYGQEVPQDPMDR